MRCHAPEAPLRDVQEAASLSRIEAQAAKEEMQSVSWPADIADDIVVIEEYFDARIAKLDLVIAAETVEELDETDFTTPDGVDTAAAEVESALSLGTDYCPTTAEPVQEPAGAELGGTTWSGTDSDGDDTRITLGADGTATATVGSTVTRARGASSPASSRRYSACLAGRSCDTLDGTMKTPELQDDLTRKRQRIARLLLVLCAGFVLLVTLFPTAPSLSFPAPLESVLAWMGIPTGYAESVLEAILNVLMFVPLGCLMVVFMPDTWPWWLAALACAALSLGVELIQGVALAGRSATVIDFVTNSTGGALGALAAMLWLQTRPRRAEDAQTTTPQPERDAGGADGI